MHTLMPPLPKVLKGVKEVAPSTTLQMKDWSLSILLCGISVFAHGFPPCCCRTFTVNAVWEDAATLRVPI